MASSSSSTEAVPPWVELPREITTAIFHKLGMVEILVTVQKVCTTWRRVCQDPATWRHIHIPYSDGWAMPLELDGICRNAVDLSQGHRTDVKIERIASDDLILYISQRSTQLRSLPGITSDGLELAVKSLPLLEEAHLYLNFDSINEEDVEKIGQSFPLSKSFKLNGSWYRHYNVRSAGSNANARRIHQLQLSGNVMTYKDLRLPIDPMDDYPFPGDGIYEFDWNEEDNDDALSYREVDFGDCYRSD